MNWTAFFSNIISRVPIERVLFPPRDSAKSLEKFAASLTAPGAQNKAPISENVTSTIAAEREGAATVPAPAARHGLPTSEETTQALKRRLGKELYKAELDLSNKLRIAGKPCDCLESKHTLLLEAVAEELIAQEPDNPVYLVIIDWIKQNQSKVTIEAISTGQYDDEYPRMAAEFKGFRKRIMGTTVLTAMVEPKKQMNPEDAKKLTAEEEGRKIAEQIGEIRYDGEQELIGHQFTDLVTGTTFYGDTVEEVRRELIESRKAFGVEKMTKGKCPHCGGPLDKDGCCPKCLICPLPKPQK